MTETTPAEQAERRERYAAKISKGGFGQSLRELTDAAIAVADAEQAELRARLTDYENRITWGTTCGSCAHVLDSSIRETERAEQAEAAVARVRRLHDRLATETELAAPDDRITRADAAERIAAALDMQSASGPGGAAGEQGPVGSSDLEEAGPEFKESAGNLNLGRADGEPDSYAERVNAPLSDSTITALNQRLQAGDIPVRTVRRREAGETEQPECSASRSGDCLREAESETACDTEAGECVHGGKPGGEAQQDEAQAAPDTNSGPGWYEVISPRATTCIAYVHENGDLYLPEGDDSMSPTEFAFAAARGNAHRLVRADEELSS